jgi:hypothetical protein
VRTSEILEDIGELLERFVVLPSSEAVAALQIFVLHTWAIEAAHATPYIVAVSPEKQSGKTKLLETLGLLVREPWRTASCTEAALFRKIEQSTPTLLLDEIDALFNSNTDRTEPLRAVLNAGNLRGSCATRVVGQGTKMEARDFSTFCPKVLAGINSGKLPETIRDRAIVLDMKRRVEGEHVDRLRYRFVVEETKPLREELELWAASAVDELREAVPELPFELSDRAGDAWEPLFAIADYAEGDWGERARTAAIALSGSDDDDEVGRGAQLLGAIRSAMDGRPTIPTVELLEILNNEDELPYGGWRDGRGLDARSLARILRPYGVKRTTFRLGESTHKGYASENLSDAWARYLPRRDGNNGNTLTSDQSLAEKPHSDGAVTGVTGVTPVTEGARNGHGVLAPQQKARLQACSTEEEYNALAAELGGTP